MEPELEIRRIPIEPYSLSLMEIHIGENTYFPFSGLASTLGYANAGALAKIISPGNRYTFNELYGLYLVEAGDSYCAYPLPFPQFKKAIKGISAPYLFTDIEGISQALSRNTITAEPVKQAVCTALGISSIQRPPNSETQFYSALQALIKTEPSLHIERHVYIAGYFADAEVTGLDTPIIIEYDENGHAYYDKHEEERREGALRQLGYYIIRIDDSKPPVESAAIVHKQISNLLYSQATSQLPTAFRRWVVDVQG